MKKDVLHDHIEFSGGGLPVKVMADKFVPPDLTVPEFGKSWHEELEIKYILSGRIRFFIEDELFEAEAGDTIIVNPYESHVTMSGNEGSSYHMILLQPSGFFGKLEGKNDELYKAFFEGRTKFPRKICGGIIPRIVCGIAEAAVRPYGELAVAGLLRLLFAEIFASGEVGFADVADVQSVRDKKRLEPVLSFVAEHPEENLGLDRLAEMCCVNKFYLSRLFKRTMHMGLHEYVDEVRRVKAEEMLLAEDCKLIEIANAVGMRDEYYFSRWFKKFHGESPTGFRSKKSR